MKSSPLFSRTRIALSVLILLLVSGFSIFALRGVSADTFGKFGITEQSRVGQLIKRIAPSAKLAGATKAPPPSPVGKTAPFATLTVTSGADSGAGTLRNQIAAAAAGDTIIFSGVTTVSLTSGELLINKNLTIDGGAGVTVTRGSGTFRIFNISSGTVAMNNMSITNGLASGQAGGIQNNGILTLTNCAINNNRAPQAGGIQNDNSLTMTGCTVSGNTTSSSFGAGVLVYGSTTNLTNCTIANNSSALDSGGFAIDAAFSATLTNCTIVGNSAATGYGGGVSLVNGGANVTLKNTVVLNNTAPTNSNIQGTLNSASANNLVGSVGTGGLTNGTNGNQVGVSLANALLGTLGNYGGTTQTIPLLPGSPAINAGTSTGAPTTDQRDKARFGTTDIGAFESQGFVLAVGSGGTQSTTINTAFGSPLTVNVTANNTADSEPVNGGQVTFTVPGSGATCALATNPATISSGAASSGTATANGTAGGPYMVTAAATGASPSINFNLTNTTPSADLAITKTDGVSTATPGGSVMYTITASNAGPSNVTGATVADTFPAILTCTWTCVGAGGGTCTASGAGNINNTVNLPSGGSVTYTASCTISPSATGTLTNTATVSAPGGVTDPTPGNNFSTDSDTLTTSSDLSVTKVDTPDPVLAGNNLTYTITVNNAGPSNASSVSLSDTLPSGTTFVSLAPPGGWSCSTPGVGSTGTVTCTNTLLGVSNAVFTLVTKVGSGVAGGTVLSNTASVSSSTTDPSSGNNSATATTTVVACPSAFTVNDLGDAADATPGDYQCSTSGGVCTLRAAIQEANAITACSPLTINFSVAGTIDLGSVLPDLNHPNLTIDNGTDPTTLTVRRVSSGNYRIFTIANGRTVTIKGVTVRDGDVSALSGAAAIGGGIYINNNGNLTLNDCVVSNNVATSGGGIFLAFATMTINRSAIRDNAIFTGTNGVQDAAGIFAGGTITMTDSTISGNRRTDAFPTAIQGAGMAVRGGAVTATNCTFSGNIGRHVILVFPTSGGSSPSALTLTNCTVAGNTLNSTGVAFGAIDTGGLDATATATAIVKNTIVGGNTATTGAAWNVAYRTAPTFTTLTSLGNNLTSDATLTPAAGGDLSNTNPLVAALGNYGGPTQTHALLPGSPAINAGTNTGAPATDQRGIARPQQTTTDIGAFESQGFTLAVSSGNNQSAVTNTTFALPLSVTVTSASSEPVNGGQVTFTPPGSGASATIAGNPATIASGVATSGTVMANAIIGGPYSVSAAANGASAINFSLTNTNSPPTFTPAAGISRQQGSPAGAAVTVGTVADAQTVAGSLTVTQIAGGTATGVTVTSIVNTGGTITAVVTASCTATAGTVRFQVSDGSLPGTGDLTVNISPNTAPTLSYAAVSVNAGSATTNSPTTATDNGSITSYAVQSQGTYTGAISVNASGVVSISSAAPIGSHIITIRATDNCGAFTDAAFTLTVNNNAPTITAAASLSRQQGSAGTVSTIATVGDGETPVGSLVVTATTVPAGITVTSITNVAGTITANVAASCTATVGANTVVLTVTDGNSGTATANLTINVTANTAPTLTYASVSVGAGGSTSNTPTVATDNGSITGYAVQSQGTYTGTISVNASGVVSISNAAPVGSHTITIRGTDNCGATTDATFSLSVGNNAPTITPAATLIRQRGTAGSVSTIATVSDGETPAGSLVVTATTVPAGITISSIVNNNGTITANIAASCTATLNNNTIVLTVTDGNSGTATGNLIVNVTDNSAPTLSYAASTVALGSAITVNATTASDNGSITGFSIVSVTPAMTVAPTVNSSGVVSITNAGPFGSHTIIVRATDNCGATTDASFTLGVGCGTITVNPFPLTNGLTFVAYTETLSATGGSGSYAFTLQSGSLPAGLMLSGNVISGTPNTAGASTFTIRATDDNGCFGDRNYTLVIGSSGLMFYPLARPVRLLDTRPGASPNACYQPNAPIAGGTSRLQPVRGTCEGLTIPANATTLTGNVTTVDSGGGFVTLYPSDAPQPLVANSNFLPNEIVNNAFTVGIGVSDGAIKIYVTTNTDVVIDVTGYYAPPGAGGLYFHPLPKPIRLLETRAGFSGCQATSTPLAGGATRTQLGIITCDGLTIPSGAQALVGNVATVNPQNGGYLTLFPADASQPFVASSNFLTGQIVNAPFTVGLSPSGEFKIFTTAATDLVIDVVGYYSTQVNDTNGQGLLFNSLGSPLRLLDTRTGEQGCFTPGTPMIAGTTYTQATQVPCTNLTPTARALIGNATVVNSTASGYLTFWPSNATQPTVSASNYVTGQIFNRHFTVGLGADGAFKRYSSATTDLVIDISGFFAP
jgi:uncharacterized repeat protein (TIGR01451 family)/CSLREA domain-containing protein